MNFRACKNSFHRQSFFHRPNNMYNHSTRSDLSYLWSSSRYDFSPDAEFETEFFYYHQLDVNRKLFTIQRISNCYLSKISVMSIIAARLLCASFNLASLNSSSALRSNKFVTLYLTNIISIKVNN